MSNVAEQIEALVETFARKIAAQAIDIAEQNGRADQLQRELDALHAEIDERRRRYFLVADAVARESESAEQLAHIARQTRADLAAANEEIARMRDACLQHVHGDVHTATKARLGQAVDFLHRVAKLLPDHVLDEADAILADADSKDAGEAWRELEAVYEASKRNRERHRWQDYAILDKALAAVDARRRQGAK